MRIKNVLLFYKKSAYKIYFLEERSTFNPKNRPIAQKELDRFKRAHREHYATLRHIGEILTKYGICYTKVFRGQVVDYDAYDLVITIGGDGTFLEAARNVSRSPLLGVNSSVSYSVGNFCIANINNFEGILQRILQKNFQMKTFHRLHLDVDQHRNEIDCLNDILVCHSNPAAMSRYLLTIGKVTEEHRSSGVWIATPSGSSGGVLSAGGKKIAHTARKLQYMPRELYWGIGWKYRLTGGILPAGQNIKMTSLMRDGRIYVDGTHIDIPFPFGVTAHIALSSRPIRTIDI
jgi:NAD+ kinase